MSVRQKTAIVLVGPPAAGKSTWLENTGPVKAGLITKAHNDVIWLCSTDNIISEIALTYGKTYNEAFSCIQFAEKVFFDRIKQAVDKEESLVIDRTNMSVGARSKVMNLIPADYVKIAVVFTKPDDEEWQRRLNSREGKAIPGHVLDSMVKNFVMPTKEEGFDVIYVAT